jgi:hypothetical protein
LSEEIDAFGSLPRDWAKENLGISPVFRLEKTGETFIEIVELRTAGDTLNVPVLPVDDKLKVRFEAEYQAWKAGLDPNGGKTLLASWGILSVKQITELKRHNVETVEDLAALSDSHTNILPDGRRMRDRAGAFLENSGDSKTLRELQAELKALREESASLRAIVTSKKGKI